jgi:hypothetical protein
VHTNKRRVNKEKKADFSRTQTSKQFACAAAAAATAAGLHTFLKGLFIAGCVAILFSHFVRQFDFFSAYFCNQATLIWARQIVNLVGKQLAKREKEKRETLISCRKSLKKSASKLDMFTRDKSIISRLQLKRTVFAEDFALMIFKFALLAASRRFQSAYGVKLHLHFWHVSSISPRCIRDYAMKS